MTSSVSGQLAAMDVTRLLASMTPVAAVAKSNEAG